jgi:hypothetical protein
MHNVEPLVCLADCPDKRDDGWLDIFMTHFTKMRVVLWTQALHHLLPIPSCSIHPMHHPMIGQLIPDQDSQFLEDAAYKYPPLALDRPLDQWLTFQSNLL